MVTTNYTSPRPSDSTGPHISALIIDMPQWLMLTIIGALIIAALVLLYSTYTHFYPNYALRTTVQERGEKLRVDVLAHWERERPRKVRREAPRGARENRREQEERRAREEREEELEGWGYGRPRSDAGGRYGIREMY